MFFNIHVFNKHFDFNFFNIGHFIIELLLEKKLPMAVLNTLKYDKDPFVKSKALECLDNMVSILDIWEKSLKDSDLMVSFTEI